MKQQKNQSLSHGQGSAIETKKRRKNRVYICDKHSLYYTLLENSGEALFVRPARWTDLHAQLLGARWEELPPCDTPKPVVKADTSSSRGPRKCPETAATLISQLETILEPKTKPYLQSYTVKKVFKTLWPTAFTKLHNSQNLDLYFGCCVYLNAVEIQLMWSIHGDEEMSSSCSSSRTASPQPAGSLCVPARSSSEKSRYNCPMIAYISKRQLESVHNRPFGLKNVPRGAQNGPVMRLHKLCARKPLPSNSDQDAYLVAIFLGMAQKRFYPPPPETEEPKSQDVGTKKPGDEKPGKKKRELRMAPKQGMAECPDFHDLKLSIITHDAETKEFIIYTSNVTKGFLRKFHNPFRVPRDDGDAALPGLKIEFTRVPIWPLVGLRERLGKALGHEIVGAFDENQMETWERGPEKEAGEKRKRDPSPELPGGDDSDIPSKRNKCVPVWPAKEEPTTKTIVSAGKGL
ncbi:hypothetical protein LB507_011694 [Fusarium sp. FIESC RH6]|nr:hypothetical protein LB507_011673 [Fusarium sp. FIESC RH6]KAI1071380.1 hypothetical protein LB507_011694 [Fusarium sp. FIESC RH6]